jgi:hypothetical protein
MPVSKPMPAVPVPDTLTRLLGEHGAAYAPPPCGGIFGDVPEGEPFIVPLAIPYVAGPSALATEILLMSQDPTHCFAGNTDYDPFCHQLAC